MPICKDCMYELFHSWVELYDGNHKMAFKRLCMSFDIYYNDKLFFACDSLDIEVIIGNYMKKFNMVQYKNKTFEDSLAEGFDFYDLAEVEITEEVVNEELDYDDGKIRPKDIKKWGDGFNAKDYKILNTEIRKLGYNIPPLVNAYMSLSPTMKLFGTAINYGFGDVEETGILISIDEILEDKRVRHIDSFIKEHPEALKITSGANKVIYKEKKD